MNPSSWGSCRQRELIGAAHGQEEAGAATGMSSSIVVTRFSYYCTPQREKKIPVMLIDSLTRSMYKGVKGWPEKGRRGGCSGAVCTLYLNPAHFWLAGPLGTWNCFLPLVSAQSSWCELFSGSLLSHWQILQCTQCRACSRRSSTGCFLRGGELRKINLGIGVAQCRWIRVEA